MTCTLICQYHWDQLGHLGPGFCPVSGVSEGKMNNWSVGWWLLLVPNVFSECDAARCSVNRLRGNKGISPHLIHDKIIL